MVKRRLDSKRGFTLVEVMVTVALFLMVMLLLFRGVTAVTSTVTLGQRQSRLHRNVQRIRRVMDDDLRSMVMHEHWPVQVGDATAEAPQLMLAFLKYRSDTEGDTETEWVQYWREEHAGNDAGEDRLETWVRYAAAASNRRGIQGEWWTTITRDDLVGEVLADDLIQVDVKVFTSEGMVSGVVSNQVEVVDVELYLTTTPVPLVFDPVDNALRRLWQEEGTWTHFRSRPDFVGGPDLRVTP
ncbi:prepilin-type N-terminal cleavage/methylation domain-containing protein [Kiritimatiellota bacterium B12222]|nr:prepilin-type N-terminal cleavage/methylation domain-containing protein [Kiritimatiellota bacterium B12222]